MKADKRILKTTIIILLICILCPLVFLYAMTNTTELKSGKIYYSCLDNFVNEDYGAYEFDIQTRISKRVRIDGCGMVYYYLPVNDGYYAVAQKDDGIAVLHNDIKLTDRYVKNISLKEKYLFYIYGDYERLFALNTETNETVEIAENLPYGYAFSDHYLYYNERDPEKPELEKNIVCIDISRDTLKKEVVDTGIVCRNSDNRLLFRKGNKLYQYDFSRHKAVLADKNMLISDNYQHRYLGTLNANDKHYMMHLNQKVLYEGSYEEYESEMMRGLFPPSDLHIRLFSRLVLNEDGKGKLYIPIKNTDRVSVSAYENDGNIVYIEQACTYWIY